jgi:hypothetical protein
MTPKEAMIQLDKCNNLQDLKRCFREVSEIFHPDLNPDRKDATSAFQMISNMRDLKKEYIENPRNYKNELKLMELRAELGVVKKMKQRSTRPPRPQYSEIELELMEKNKILDYIEDLYIRLYRSRMNTEERGIYIQNNSIIELKYFQNELEEKLSLLEDYRQTHYRIHNNFPKQAELGNIFKEKSSRELKRILDNQEIRITLIEEIESLYSRVNNSRMSQQDKSSYFINNTVDELNYMKLRLLKKL